MSTIETKFDKEVRAGSKSVTFLWVATIILFLASVSAIVGLWVSYRNDRESVNVAIYSGAESGEVMGTTTKDPNYLINLTDNLKTGGVVLYGFDGDQETKKQLTIFGQAVASLDYVECNSQSSHANAVECAARGVDDYPTWIKDDKKFIGYKTLEDLEKILSSE